MSIFGRKPKLTYEQLTPEERNAVDYHNARFAVTHKASGVTLAVWGRNLFDDRTPSDYQPITETGHPFGLDFFLPNSGDSYGIDLSIRF